MFEALSRRIVDKVVVQHIGAETLVYDEQRQMAFCLNATSAAVWNAANGTRTIAALAADATRVLATPVSEQLVVFTLAGLQRDGLLQAEAPAAATAAAAMIPAAISRRSMLRTLGTGSALLLPVVAAIVAPRAAQAYTGCFDCSNASTAAQRSAIRRADKRRHTGQQGAPVDGFFHSFEPGAPYEPADSNQIGPGQQ